ncbi:MAG: hypothetical protein MHPSP_000888 [Paramarteilia canceri]
MNVTKYFLGVYKKQIFRYSLKIPLTAEAIKSFHKHSKLLLSVNVSLSQIISKELKDDSEKLINSTYIRIISWIRKTGQSNEKWIIDESKLSENCDSWLESLDSLDVPRIESPNLILSTVLYEFLHNLYTLRRDMNIMMENSDSSKSVEYIMQIIGSFVSILNRKKDDIEYSKTAREYIQKFIIPDMEAFYGIIKTPPRRRTVARAKDHGSLENLIQSSSSYSLNEPETSDSKSLEVPQRQKKL